MKAKVSFHTEVKTAALDFHFVNYEDILDPKLQS